MKRSVKKPLPRDARILALRRDNHTHAEIAQIITQEYGPITKQWVRAIIERLTWGSAFPASVRGSKAAIGSGASTPAAESAT